MAFNEIVTEILLPFGGISFVLVALATFLGNINTKRIVNGDLAKHKLDLEHFKNESQLSLQTLKDRNALDLELIKLEHSKNMDKVQNEFRTEFLKFETYSSISKEKFQLMFEKRIEVYEKFLSLKNEIDEYVVENAEHFAIDSDNPTHFTDALKKINQSSQQNLMLISDELAVLSNELYEKSSKIFADAKVTAFYAEMESYGNSDDDGSRYDYVLNAENNELRKMFDSCGEIYENWFTQLNQDVSRIRKILDVSGSFLHQKY